MITATLRMKALPGKRQEVLDILHTLQDVLRVKQDCIDCKLYETYGEHDSVLYIEHWRTRHSLRRHIQSDLYKRILMVMELAEDTPQIIFQESDTVEGMELIASLRNEP